VYLAAEHSAATQQYNRIYKYECHGIYLIGNCASMLIGDNAQVGMLSGHFPQQFGDHHQVIGRVDLGHPNSEAERGHFQQIWLARLQWFRLIAPNKVLGPRGQK
jgi:hypothetical protein